MIVSSDGSKCMPLSSQTILSMLCNANVLLLQQIKNQLELAETDVPKVATVSLTAHKAYTIHALSGSK